jgi:hypothetical protein
MRIKEKEKIRSIEKKYLLDESYLLFSLLELVVGGHHLGSFILSFSFFLFI